MAVPAVSHQGAGTHALRLAVLLGAAFAFAAAMMLGQAAPAEAYRYQFCWSNGNLQIAPGSRCVDTVQRKVKIVEVRGINSDGTPPGTGTGYMCVGAKQYSNGTGSDTTPFGCIYRSQGESTFSGPYDASVAGTGYSTVINNTNKTLTPFGAGEGY